MLKESFSVEDHSGSYTKKLTIVFDPASTYREKYESIEDLQDEVCEIVQKASGSSWDIEVMPSLIFIRLYIEPT